MMCQPCKGAGVFNQLATSASDVTVGPLQDEAKKLHNQCEYPQNCTCQHVLGDVINRGQPS